MTPYLIRRIPLFVCLALVVWTLAGCCPTVSLNPLSDPGKAMIDKRLEGVWFARIEDSVIWLHMGKNQDNTLSIQSVEHGADGKMNVDERIQAFSTVLETGSFLNIKQRYLVKGDDENGDSYSIVMYAFDGPDRLTFYLWDEKKIEEDIALGKVKGVISESPWNYKDDKGKPYSGKEKCVKLTDDSEHLAGYVQAEGAKTLFSKPFGTFERITVQKGK